MIVLTCAATLVSAVPVEQVESASKQLDLARAASGSIQSAQALAPPPSIQQRHRRQLPKDSPPRLAQAAPGAGDPTNAVPEAPEPGNPATSEAPQTTPQTQDPPTSTNPPPSPTPPSETTTTTTISTTTTTVSTTTTTTTSDPPSTSSSEEETTTTSRRVPTRSHQPTRPTNNPPGGPPPGQGPNTTVTPSPSGTPSGNGDDDSKPPLLPIILGSVIGGVILISAAAFFIWRWRKSRRFDSKRPLSFVSLPTDMQDVDYETAQKNGGSGRPLTAQPSLRYTPPDETNAFAALARNSGGMGPVSEEYRSSFHHSDHSSNVDPYLMDDENTRLVTARDGVRSASPYPPAQRDSEDAYGLIGMRGGIGGGGASPHRQGSAALIGPGMDDDVYLHRPPSNQSFVATSMVPVAHDDPIHTRYSRTVNEAAAARSSPASSTLEPTTAGTASQGGPSVGSPVGSPTVQYQSVSLHRTTSQAGSVHSETRAPSSLSIRNPSEPAGDQQDANNGDSHPRSEQLDYL
ncbi:hypothetical protein BGW41_007840 [Actinomortierella wolfii]|nr:hypothetical protein BGW41_007840 [Actinomortierella wolfii]